MTVRERRGSLFCGIPSTRCRHIIACCFRSFNNNGKQQVDVKTRVASSGRRVGEVFIVLLNQMGWLMDGIRRISFRKSIKRRRFWFDDSESGVRQGKQLPDMAKHVCPSTPLYSHPVHSFKFFIFIIVTIMDSSVHRISLLQNVKTLKNAEDFGNFLKSEKKKERVLRSVF